MLEKIIVKKKTAKNICFILLLFILHQKKKKKIIVHIVLGDETWQDCTKIVCGGLKFFTLCVEDKGSCEIYSYLSIPAKGASCT